MKYNTFSLYADDFTSVEEDVERVLSQLEYKDFNTFFLFFLCSLHT